MADHVREGVEQAINACQLAPDGQQKSTQLKVLQELLVRKDPLLLDDYIVNVCELQLGAPAPFKKSMAEFLKNAAMETRSPTVLLHCMKYGCLTLMTSDDTASVVKTAIQWATAVARKGFEIVFSQGSLTVPTPNLPSLWTSLTSFSHAVEAILSTEGNGAGQRSDAVRVAAVKYAEQYALVISADLVIKQLPSNKVIKAADLTQRLHTLLHALASLLRIATFSSLSSSLGMVAVKAAGSVAAARDKAQGLLLPPLIALANSGKYTLKKPAVDPSSSPGASLADSIGSALKHSLVLVIRNGGAQTKAWHNKLVAALEALGAAEEAQSALRHVQRAQKRQLEGPGAADDARKRLRNSVDRQTPPPNGLRPGSTTPPGPKPLDPRQAAAQPAHAAPQLSTWQHALQTLELLAAQQRTNDIDTVISSLPPPWLVEIVLANLRWLPSQQEFQTHMACQQPPQGPPQTGVATGAAALVPPPPPPLDDLPGHVAGPTGAAEAPGRSKGPVMAGVLQPKPASPQPGALPVQEDAKPTVKLRSPPRLAPLDIQPEEAEELRLNAVQRMLACRVTPLQHLQHGLLVRLATLAPVGREIDSSILDHAVGALSSHPGPINQQQSPQALKLLLDMLYAQHAIVAGAANDRSREQAAGRYQALLMDILQRLRDCIKESPAAVHLLPCISQLIHEAPNLPAKPLMEFLEEQLKLGVTTNSEDVLKQTLIIMRVLVSDHPPVRTASLKLLLQQATSPVDKVRELALRVVAARFYKEEHPEITPMIEHFILRKLNAAMEDKKAIKQEAQQVAAAEGGTDTAAENGSAAEGQTVKEEQDLESQAAADVDLLCVLAVKPFGVDRLFHTLMDAYGVAPPHVQAAVDVRAASMARSLGFGSMSQHVLADYITEPPPGSEKLLLKMLAVLCDTPQANGAFPIPPQLMLGSCKAAKASRNDVRFLGVAISGLEVEEACALLPALVQLTAEEWEAVVARLLRPNARFDGASMMKAEDLMTHLLMMDHVSSGTPLKSLMTAVSVCLNKQGNHFTNSVLSVVLQQCKQRQPLPVLFMRLVILTYDRAPELQSFLLDDVLRYLVTQQIWRDANQFKGFAVAIGKMRDSAYPLLLQLPTHALAEALKQPAISKAKPKLAQLAAAMNLPQASRQLLQA